MLGNMLSVKRLLPQGGAELKVYPDAQDSSGQWIVAIDSTRTGQKYLRVPGGAIPKGIPDSGGVLRAVPKGDDEWTLSFEDIHGNLIRQARVPGSSSLKKALEDLVQSKIQSLVPSIMKLL